MSRWRPLSLALLISLLLAACGPSLIGDTQIADTPEHRAILQVVERYRQAMERRDFEAIKSLVSTRYYENGSSTGDASDDWGYPDLERVLKELGGALRTVTYDIQVKAIHLDGPRAEVDYEYTWNFQYSDGDQDGWSRKSDVNRLSLLKEGSDWKFVAGL